MKSKLNIILLGFLFGLISVQGQIQITTTERNALQDLYNATNGPNWLSENDNDPNNDWDFTQNSVVGWYGLEYNGGHLTGLYLDDNNLSGAIPHSMGSLSYLDHLYLSGNNISSLPTSIGSLVNLRYLELSDNLLNSIPSSIGNLIGLRELFLSKNRLTTFPLGLNNLTNLRELHLHDNQISGIMPNLSNLNDLWSLLIYGNKLHFGDFENQYGIYSGLNVFGYTPQSKIDGVSWRTVQSPESITLTTTVSGSQNHYKWFKDGIEISGHTDSPTLTISNSHEYDSGYYTCEVTSDIVTGLTLVRKDMYLYVQPDPYKENRNTITTTTYDISEISKTSSKLYFNEIGKIQQTQSWNREYNSIWASELMYDYFGRPALSSLSAPISNGSIFQYKEGFIRNDDGSVLTLDDLEINPSNPPNIGGIINTLGWYYSNNNYRENLQDITEHPFSRNVYSTLIPGKILTSVGGNRIDSNGDDEIFWYSDAFLKSYTFTVQASQELSQSLAFDDQKYNSIQVLKTVSRDVHGNENVVFTDTDGKVLATARSGGSQSRTMTVSIGEQGYVDIHVPQGDNMGFTVNLPGGVTYRVYNLITEGISNDSPLASNGFYRVAVNDPDNYSGGVTVTYKENYYDYTLNYYDEANRLVKSTQPLGRELETIYDYNTLGQLVYSKSPDEGESWFKYRADGQIRFSQNSIQEAINEVSYTNYDELGRPIKSGILSGANFSTLNADEALPTTTNHEDDLVTEYDTVLDTSQCTTDICTIIETLGGQRFINGNVSKTESTYSSTYYSYDVYGRVEWLVQYIDGLGVKTINYQYHPISGLVEEVLYQKDKQDQFIHRYTYDGIDRLEMVETSSDGQNFTKQAIYEYYETGSVKRIELAPNTQGVPLQGIDYIYNLNGQLKAINHPSLNASYDPDGIADIFGMQLDYHNTDFWRDVPGIETPMYGANQYNGNIKGVRWNSDQPSQTSQAYSYEYNRNNWLTGADYGEYSEESGSGALPPSYTDTAVYANGTTTLREYSENITLNPGFHAHEGSDYTARVIPNDGFNNLSNSDYDVSNINYDSNGNILSLKRNKDGAPGNNGMDDLSYVYKAGTNQLDHVTDSEGNGGSNDIDNQNSGNYVYNAIGQLVYEDSEKIDYFYNASGLVREVQKDGQPLVKFFYNDRNHRVKKEVYSSGVLQKTSYYVRDIGGQVMAIHEDNILLEQPVYGLGRIGVYKPQDNSSFYELTDHLGNVRAVVGRSGNGTPIGLLAKTDYYPGGMQMPGRNIVGDYRYGYQGQYSEKDDETGLNAFQLRMYDSRIMRWISPDPYGEFNSPYMAMGNNWANVTDPDGGCTTCPDNANEGDTYNHPDYDNPLTFDGANWIDTGGNLALDGVTGTPNMARDIGDFVGPAIGELSGISKFMAELESNVAVNDTRRVQVGEINWWIDPDGYIVSGGYAIQGGSGALGYASSGGGILKGLQYLKNPGALKHIFRTAPGHVNPQTIGSQERYLRLFNNVVNPKNLTQTTNAAKVKARVETYHKTFNGRKQVWVEAIGGKITNAGVNAIPR
ncbi:hypothetical protein B4Q04_20165 [Zobellia sp. OII3]|uniref:leucine-rich repeat domain-containing protein n=1 Tax=Zobellia sp. OII3 TaxID=2034520 RepID=UPI000B5360C6|nr:RHS repeat-associated core domain-containing protein [Zobellia sp. OII3]OWW23516.1 hypothetical protein B4Q04_20165 [Zobellia sp. OII3]